MEYDKNVARLEAALVERTPNFLSNVAKVFDACDDRKKLHCVLLLNVDEAIDFLTLSTDQELRFRPLHTLQQKIDMATFFAVVSECRLWSFFYECLSFLPVTPTLLDSDVVKGHYFERDDYFASTSFVAALIRRCISWFKNKQNNYLIIKIIYYYEYVTLSLMEHSIFHRKFDQILKNF